MDRWRIPHGSGTHVLMDGGILSVPYDEIREFYEKYVELVSSGIKLYVVEQKTEFFKFFIDFDYKAPEKLDDDDLLQFCTIIHSVVQKGRCIIARARVRPVGEGLLKSGVHIHWPDLVVNRTEALNLRTKIIASLGTGPWDTVIDASVYSGSGLRMLWSHKKPTGDPYVPWKELETDGEFSKVPTVEMLELCSVRTSETVRPVEILQDASSLERFVQRYLSGQEHARIKRVQRNGPTSWFVQTDSMWCENARRKHKSNHVWFAIDDGFVFQKCFDEDCREFSGPKQKLPPSIVEQLEDVAIMGYSPSSFFMDIFPNGSGCEI